MEHIGDFELYDSWRRTSDAQSFQELIRRYAGMVYGTCHRILKNAADAEEITQECFFALARNKEEVRQSLAGWLYSVAVHRSLNRLRGDRRRKQREREHVAAGTRVAEDSWSDLEEHIDEAIAALPEDARAAVVAFFLQGKTQDETAAILGVSQATISRRIDAGIKSIRESLRKRGHIISIAALTAGLHSFFAEATPETVLAALGKIALGGGISLAVPGAFWGMTSKITATVLFSALAVIAGIFITNAAPVSSKAPIFLSAGTTTAAQAAHSEGDKEPETGGAVSSAETKSSVGADAGVVEQSGVIVIPRGLSWDADFDILGTPPNHDLTWRNSLSVYRNEDYPDAEDKASISLIKDASYEAIDYHYLAALGINQQGIEEGTLKPGTVIAMRTSEGALAKLRVNQYYKDNDVTFKGAERIGEHRKYYTLKNATDDSRFNIELEWTLYQKKGPEDSGLSQALRAKLSNAILLCDTKAAQNLLKAHPDLVNVKNEFNKTPLIEAAEGGSEEMVRALLDAGADVNLPEEPDGETPLIAAAGSGVVGKVDALIASGADVNAKWGQETVLTSGIYSGNPEVVELLLKRGAKLTGKEMPALQQRLINKSYEDDFSEGSSGSDGKFDDVRRTPGPEDFEEISRIILAYESNVPEPVDREGVSLPEVAGLGEIGVVRQLLQSGVDINTKGKRGRTALHEAASADAFEMVEFLIEQGADVNARDDVGQAPLHKTAHCRLAENLRKSNRGPQTAEALLSAGAAVDSPDAQGWTPLHHARYHENEDVANILINRGADIASVTDDGFTPENIDIVLKFFVAVSKAEDTETSKLIETYPQLLNTRCALGGELMSKVAFSDAVTKSHIGTVLRVEDPARQNGGTALHEAILDEQEDMVKLLLKKKADINATDFEEQATPLHVACWVDSQSILELLLTTGANANQANASGDTPLHIAVQYCPTPFVETLLTNGANPNVKNNKNLSPLQLELQQQIPMKADLIEQLKQVEETKALLEKAGGENAIELGQSETEIILRKYGAK